MLVQGYIKVQVHNKRMDMAVTIIYLVISLLVSLIFIIFGIRQYRAKKPVTINMGEKPPREDELTSVAEWRCVSGGYLYDSCIC